MDQIREKTGYDAAGAAVILPFEKRGEYTVEPLGEIEDKPVYSFIKRTFDVVASAVALLVLFIPMVVIGLSVCLTSEGGAFFVQERLGKDGKPFRMVKFRTMRKDAERNGAQWSRGDNDERITKVGAFLRKVRLDVKILFKTVGVILTGGILTEPLSRRLVLCPRMMSEGAAA